MYTSDASCMPDSFYLYRSQSMFNKQSGTDATHHLICSLNTFLKQLHVGRETHLTFIATFISIYYVTALCVWFPIVTFSTSR